MSRVPKRGLDYFPMNTDFLQNRLLRRLVKRKGDVAVFILLQAYCAIYGGEGYYVVADEMFYDDLSDLLREGEAKDVRDVIALAVEFGLFDAGMFSQYGILTSAEIQRQYLFITRRRSTCPIDERYLLLPAESASEEPAEAGTEKGINVAEKPQSATEKAENTPSTAPKYTKKTKENKSKENPLLDSSPENVGTAGTAPKAVEDEPLFVRREWTQADVARLQPPADGLNRNLDGLLCNLMQFRVPPAEQYAIVLKSNFGVIGHPVWKGFEPLRTSHGKIRQPGRYLLSLCGGGR